MNKTTIDHEYYVFQDLRGCLVEDSTGNMYRNSKMVPKKMHLNMKGTVEGQNINMKILLEGYDLSWEKSDLIRAVKKALTFVEKDERIYCN